MIDDPFWQWTLTIAFTATSIASAIQLFSARRARDAIGELLHVIMGVVMVAMCWPWWGELPAAPQLLVFLAGTAWYAALILRMLFRRTGAPRSLWHLFTHLAMMLGMVWMIAVMLLGGAATVDSHHGASLGLWEASSGVLVTIVLTVSAATASVDSIVSRNFRAGSRHIGTAVMSAGMAIMCWAMLAH